MDGDGSIIFTSSNARVEEPVLLPCNRVYLFYFVYTYACVRVCLYVSVHVRVRVRVCKHTMAKFCPAFSRGLAINTFPTKQTNK